MTESAYDKLRLIEDHYTAQINSLIGAGREDQVADLAAHFEDEVREARDAYRRAA